MKCYNCGLIGHKARNGRKPRKLNDRSGNGPSDVSVYAHAEETTHVAFRAEDGGRQMWCLDSGCTSHMCRDAHIFQQISTDGTGQLHLASNASTCIAGKWPVSDWHIKLGHLNVQYLRDAVRQGILRGINMKNIDESFECKTCIRGRHRSRSRSTFRRMPNNVHHLAWQQQIFLHVHR